MRKTDNMYAAIVSRGSTAEEKACLLFCIIIFLIEKKKKILFCIIGHPSFQTLRFMFPKILKGIKDDNLVCEVCERAKHSKYLYRTESSVRYNNSFN